ncbi:MAG: hypothetical protein R3F56_10485 [Planctomycetota bacterium]
MPLPLPDFFAPFARAVALLALAFPLAAQREPGAAGVLGDAGDGVGRRAAGRRRDHGAKGRGVDGALLAGGIRREEPEKVDAFKDPYTKGDADRQKALGYVATGQFLWLGEVPTTQVQQILGDDVAVFIETERFAG